jgi:diguanylate cyclase (GGDEF)-like protein/PAS domain S-box-containing protein
MFVPIRAADQVIGILTIQSYTPGAYRQDDLGTLEALADHCGGALERIRAEEALRAGEASLANAQKLAHLGDWSVDLATETVRWSDEYYRILGYVPGRVTPTYDRFLERVHPEDRERVREATGRAADPGEPFEIEFRVTHPDGEIRCVHAQSEVIRDASGTPIALVGTGHDVTERKALEERLKYLAFHDALTGLPNRALLMDRLREALARARRDGGLVCVLYVDLDGYKAVNDSLGHEAGDEVLRHVAARLRASVRPEDAVARLSGDEFVVVMEHAGGGAPEAIAERLLDRLRSPFKVGRHEVAVGASVGMALGGPGQEDPETLLRAADAALYRAKRAGKGRYAVYDERRSARREADADCMQ